MGLLKKQNNKQKKQEQEQQKELDNRAKQFVEDYKIIRKKHRCDIQSFIEFKETGLLPKVKIVDASDTIKKEEVKAKENQNGNQ